MSRHIFVQTICRDVLLTNYGSFFQHYAIRMILKSLGFSVTRSEHGSPRNEIRLLLMPLRYIRTYLLSLIGLRTRPQWSKLAPVLKRWKFVWDYWRKIGRVFEPQGACAYAFVAGGDSVWCRNVPFEYLLDRPRGIRRISYAASSAWDQKSQDDAWKKIMLDVCRSYYAIGVREQIGQAIIKTIAPSANVSVVVDPVVLIGKEGLLNVASRRRVFKKPTMLYYAVNIWDASSLNLQSIQDCASTLGCALKIVGIQGAEEYIPPAYAFAPSPAGFLAAIRDAKFVLTNSFHGVVFSVLLNKQFAFSKQGGTRYGNQNCRQEEFLKLVKLEGRMVSASPHCRDLMAVLSSNIDYQQVNEIIRAEQSRCINWLKEALA